MWIHISIFGFICPRKSHFFEIISRECYWLILRIDYRETCSLQSRSLENVGIIDSVEMLNLFVLEFQKNTHFRIDQRNTFSKYLVLVYNMYNISAYIIWKMFPYFLVRGSLFHDIQFVIVHWGSKYTVNVYNECRFHFKKKTFMMKYRKKLSFLACSLCTQKISKHEFQKTRHSNVFSPFSLVSKLKKKLNVKNTIQTKSINHTILSLQLLRDIRHYYCIHLFINLFKFQFFNMGWKDICLYSICLFCASVRGIWKYFLKKIELKSSLVIKLPKLSLFHVFVYNFVDVFVTTWPIRI